MSEKYDFSALRRVAGFVSAALVTVLFVACGVRTMPPPNPNPNPDPRLAQADGRKQLDDGKKADIDKKPRDGGKKADGGRGFVPPDDELDKDKGNGKNKADDKGKTNDKDGDVKRPARKEGESRRLAVLVGLDGYDSKDFSDLRYAEKDVEELAKVLTKAGYHQDDVVVLTGKRGESDSAKRPTVANVRKALASATKGMGAMDVLVVALAGHGIEPAKGEHSYCTYQARKIGEGKFSGLLPITEVYEQLGKAKEALKLLLVDACRNDPNARGGLPEIDGGFDTVTAPPPSRNTIAFYSCSPGERSWEPGELKHGLFMYHFLQGLRDRADYFQDGKITWQNAVSFTDREVRSYSRNQLRKLQQPHFKGEARGEVPPLVVWEGKTSTEKPAASEEEKKAFGFLQINEDFMRSSLGGRPRSWDGPDLRVATDKQNRRCLEAIGNSGQKEVTLPKVNLTGDFFIEVEYLLDGYSTADVDVHRMAVVMEGREGADRVRAEVDHAGRSIIGNSDRRKPEGYVISRENPTKGPYKVTRFRLEREGRVYRVLLNDEFAVGGEQAFSGDFDTIRISLTAGIPVSNYTLKDRARIYSVKVGTMKAATDKPAAIDGPKPGKPFAVDFRKTKLAGLPEGWQGPDFYVATDKENRRCLEAKGAEGLKPLALPRFSLKGDFLIEVEAILDGYQTADKDVHELILALQGGNTNIRFRIDHAGRTSIGLAAFTEPRIPARFKPYQVFRLRCEREGNVYRATVNDVPAVGVRIDYTGDIDAIDVGLTAGIPKSNYTLRQRARIYSVKVVPVKPTKREAKPEQPAGGVKEDFRWCKPGELPEGWQPSRAVNVSVQPGAEKSGLELVSKVVLADTVLLPKLDLPGAFVASFECQVVEKESYAALSLAGAQKNGFSIALLGDKTMVINNGKPFDVAKFWKANSPQLVQVERTAQQYKIKLNDEEVGAIGHGRAGGGAFVQGAVTLRVKDKKDPTPRVTAVRISPLK